MVYNLCYKEYIEKVLKFWIWRINKLKIGKNYLFSDIYSEWRQVRNADILKFSRYNTNL